jgi:hypothetical protein
MSSFSVVEYGTGRVLARTDDWVEAQWLAHESLAGVNALGYGRGHNMASVQGVHPSHVFADAALPAGAPEFRRRRCCTSCGMIENHSSYGIQAPCGYDFAGSSLLGALKRERAARAGRKHDG